MKSPRVGKLEKVCCGDGDETACREMAAMPVPAENAARRRAVSEIRSSRKRIKLPVMATKCHYSLGARLAHLNRLVEPGMMSSSKY